MADHSPDYVETPCPCTAPGYCPHFGRTLVGYEWAISRLDSGLGRKYRAAWAAEGPVAGKKGCNCRPGVLRKTR